MSVVRRLPNRSALSALWNACSEVWSDTVQDSIFVDDASCSREAYWPPRSAGPASSSQQHAKCFSDIQIRQFARRPAAQRSDIDSYRPSNDAANYPGPSGAYPSARSTASPAHSTAGTHSFRGRFDTSSQQLSSLHSGGVRMSNNSRTRRGAADDSREGFREPVKPRPLEREITLIIKYADSVDQIQEVLHQYRRDLNCIHIAAAITRLSRLTLQNSRDKALASQVAANLTKLAFQQLHEFGIRELANCVHSWGHLTATYKLPPEVLSAVVKVLLEEAGEKLQQALPQQLSSLATGLAKLECREPELWLTWSRVCESRLQDFSARQLTNLFWSTTKMKQGSRDLVLALAEEAGRRFDEFEPRSYGVMAWMATEYNVRQPEFLAKLADGAVEKVNALDHFALKNLVYAFAKLEFNNATAVHRIVTAVLRMPEMFAVRDLVTVIWAAAALNYKAAKTVTRLIQAAVARSEVMKPVDVSSLLWSIAKLGNLPQEATGKLLDTLTSELTRQLPEFSSLDVSNSLWALAKLQGVSQDNNVLPLLADTACKRLPGMNAQMLANVVWACGTLQLHPVGLDAAFEEVLADRVQLTGQSLALTTWGFAKLKVKNDALYRHLAEKTKDQADAEALKGFDVVQLAFAFSYVGVSDSVLYDKLAQHCVERTDEYDAHMLVSLAMALFKMGGLSPELLTVMVQRRSREPQLWEEVDSEKLQRLLVCTEHPMTATG